jgi:hypothetical protein
MKQLKQFVKAALRLPANALVASSSNMPDKLRDAMGSLTMEEPTAAAKYFPYKGGRSSYVLSRYPSPEALPTWDSPSLPKTFGKDTVRQPTSSLNLGNFMSGS